MEEDALNTLRSTLRRGVPLALFALCLAAMSDVRPAPPTGRVRPRPAGQTVQRSAGSHELDSLAMSVRRDEERAFAVASALFFQDPEDAEDAKPAFLLSSVKILRVAVDADSANAEAMYHLGLVLCEKSYSGSGKWNKRLLQEGVRRLQEASRKAVGQFAPLKAQIMGDLARELHNLSVLD
jgi:hypothetical protein